MFSQYQEKSIETLCALNWDACLQNHLWVALRLFANQIAQQWWTFQKRIPIEVDSLCHHVYWRCLLFLVKTFAKLPWQLYGRWIPAETGMLRSGVNWTARLLTLGDEQGWGAPGRAVSGWVIWMGLLWAGGGKLNYIHISGNSPLGLMLAPGFMDRRLPQCNVF